MWDGGKWLLQVCGRGTPGAPAQATVRPDASWLGTPMLEQPAWKRVCSVLVVVP